MHFLDDAMLDSLRAAAMQILEATAMLPDGNAETVHEELERRTLELTARALVAAAAELLDRTRALRAPAGVVAPNACPVCGWAFSSPSPHDGRCRRCHSLRVASPELARALLEQHPELARALFARMLEPAGALAAPASE